MVTGTDEERALTLSHACGYDAESPAGRVSQSAACTAGAIPATTISVGIQLLGPTLGMLIRNHHVWQAKIGNHGFWGSGNTNRGLGLGLSGVWGTAPAGVRGGSPGGVRGSAPRRKFSRFCSVLSQLSSELPALFCNSTSHAQAHIEVAVLSAFSVASPATAASAPAAPRVAAALQACCYWWARPPDSHPHEHARCAT